MRLSWENEEAKSRHVDFQCVRSKSITNLDNVDGVDAQVVEEQVEFGAVGGQPFAMPLAAVEPFAFGGIMAAPYLPFPANFDNSSLWVPQPQPQPPPLAIPAGNGAIAGIGQAAADVQPTAAAATGQLAASLSQAFVQQARLSSGHQHESSGSDDY